MGKYTYDIIVIGSGAGGSLAAAIAARAGKKVALIEAEKLGGDSTNFGDVPTQALLTVANIYSDSKHAAPFGIRSATVGYNYPTIRAWKDKVVARVGGSASKRYYDSLGVHVIMGDAHFISAHEISVNRRHLSAEYFVIATGAAWTIPAIEGLEKNGLHTPETILDIVRPPKSLFIIGGGPTSVEYARLFSTFGTKVYVSEIAPRLLPREDEEAGQLTAKILTEKYGVGIVTRTRVQRITKDGLGKRVHFIRGTEEHSVRVDEVLVASGKSPRIDIGLENAGVKYSPLGIEADEHLRTTAKHIYATGDVLGGFSLTHVALMESRVAAHNILEKSNIAPDYSAIPRITYMSPEIASVGLSEDDLIKRDLEYQKAIVPITIIGRAAITNQHDGFVKIIADKKTKRILGATIMSPHAGEMIHELTLAVQHKLTADAIANSLHAFPSWSEAVRVAAAKIG
jgi:pyruvate/2-oxoglutarate dehydrogenase complex dihydrolipoamide dehydrogenase (E3) component